MKVNVKTKFIPVSGGHRFVLRCLLQHCDVDLRFATEDRLKLVRSEHRQQLRRNHRGHALEDQFQAVRLRGEAQLLHELHHLAHR